MLSRISIYGQKDILSRAIQRKKARANFQSKYRQAKQYPMPIEYEPKKVIVALKYPLQALPKSDKPSGFSEPLRNTENLPFFISRTPNSQLPVYSEHKNARTRRLTILRKISGNVEELSKEIRRLIGPEHKIVSKDFQIQISGHHVAKIKYWLRRLGF